MIQKNHNIQMQFVIPQQVGGFSMKFINITCLVNVLHIIILLIINELRGVEQLGSSRGS